MNPDSLNRRKGGRSVAESLQRSLRFLVIATIFLYVVILAAGTKVYIDNKHTTDTLCTFRSDLEHRVIDSIRFLKKHPKGILGVPRKTILDSLTNQQRTVTALKDLDCGEEVPTRILISFDQPRTTRGSINPGPPGQIPPPSKRLEQLAKAQEASSPSRGRPQNTPPNPSNPGQPNPSAPSQPGPQGPQGQPGTPGQSPPSSSTPSPSPVPQVPVPDVPKPSGLLPQIIEGVCGVSALPLVCPQ